MKIAICEDEILCAEVLQNYIKKWADSRGVWVETFVYESAEQFLFFLNDNVSMDLVFLDIMMGAISGIELARKLRELQYDFHIVFTTDSKEYVYEGYNVFALNYLLKPVSYSKCSEILDNVKNMISNQKYYLCKTADELIKIPYEDIICIEMESHNAIITTTKSKYITRKTITNILDTLNSEIFMQCHKSCIVNIQHIFSISKKVLKLSNNISLDVSKSYIKNLNERFIKYNMNRR